MLIFSFNNLSASDKLVFGAISTIEPSLMEKKLLPIMKYLEKEIGKKIEFQTGFDYSDTIKKFADGTFDLGYIGPAPYIKAKKISPKSINIIAGLVNIKEKPFQSVIISKKGSGIVKLEDIKNRHFAFGSPDSTLSYYVPMDILIKKKIIKEIKRYDFLGRHDRVAQYIIMGKYDAGAIKKSVADKYAKYLQIIAKSKALNDFLFVTNSSLDKTTTQKIKNALLKLKDEKILKSLKKSALKLEVREDSDYDDLRLIIKNVEENKNGFH